MLLPKRCSVLRDRVAGIPRRPFSVKLENCTKANNEWVIDPIDEICKLRWAHRQDMKGTRWMPWHQEPKKDVDGCDKPRLGAEQPLTRGFPNGKTQHR